MTKPKTKMKWIMWAVPIGNSAWVFDTKKNAELAVGIKNIDMIKVEVREV